MSGGTLIEGTSGLVNLSDGTGWTSADGITWTRAAHPFTPRTLRPAQVVRWKGRYLTIMTSCATESSYSSAPTVVWQSSDLLRWRSGATIPRVGADCAELADVGPGVQGIVTYRGDLLAIGTLVKNPDSGRPVVFRSGDGRHWSAHPLAPWGHGDAESFVVTAEAIYAFGIGVWRSTDGLAWTRLRTNVPPGRALSTPIAGGPGFVALMDDASAIMVSADGRQWRTVLKAVDGGDVETVVRAGSPFVALGRDGNTDSAEVWMSSDGTSWDRIAAFPPGLPVGGGPTIWYHEHLIVFGDQVYVSPPVPGEQLVPTHQP